MPESSSSRVLGFGGIGLILVLGLCGGALYGCPTYQVYSARKTGEAELARADGNRQIAVQEARAKMESAKFEAEAEVTRAQGVAQANKIIGDSLKDNEAYLRYLYVNDLAHTKDQVIYVPTEGGLPILEAGKRPGGGPPP